MIKKTLAIMLAVISVMVPCFNKQSSFAVDSRELEELRTLSSKTCVLNDGTRSTTFYAEPVHYMDSRGNYIDINSSLTSSNKKDFAYMNKANSWQVYFSSSADALKLVSIVNGGCELNFSLKDSMAARSCVDSKNDNKIIYKNVFPNVDLRYTVHNSAVKEEFIINSPEAIPDIAFVLNTSGLTLQNINGCTAFADSDGNNVFELGSHYMEDAVGKRCENVQYQITQSNRDYKYSITFDHDFITDPNTVFPVIIDPQITVTGASSTFDTCVDQQYPSSNYYLSEKLWTGGKLGTNAMRTYIKFDLPTSFYGNQITSAYLRIKKDYYAESTVKAYRVTSSWTASTITWNNKPGHRTSGTKTIVHDTGDWYKINTTTIVRSWMNGDANYGFVLKEPSESNESQKTRYYSSDAASPNKPELVINYVSYWGTRPYQTAPSGRESNCMGYALNVREDVQLLSNYREIVGMNTSQILTYINSKAVSWMNSNIGSSNYSSISTYYSSINNGWYRVALRVGFSDNDGDGVYDLGETFDYHWIYQTSENYGQWAEKRGSYPSARIVGSCSGINPCKEVWHDLYNSAGKYYQVRYAQSINW